MVHSINLMQLIAYKLSYLNLAACIFVCLATKLFAVTNEIANICDTANAK